MQGDGGVVRVWERELNEPDFACGRKKQPVQDPEGIAPSRRTPARCHRPPAEASHPLSAARPAPRLKMRRGGRGA
jgi:hypothetical protein